jgi:hypothetical protein
MLSVLPGPNGSLEARASERIGVPGENTLKMIRMNRYCNYHRTGGQVNTEGLGRHKFADLCSILAAAAEARCI